MSPAPPGIHSSGPTSPGAEREVIIGHAKSRGMTARTWRGRLLRTMVRPMRAGSAAKWRRHRPSLSTTADGSAAFEWNGSPSSGRAPSTSKKVDETLDPFTRSGSPEPVTVNDMWLMPAKPLKLVDCDRKSIIRPGPSGSMSPPGRVFQRKTSRSGRGNGSGLMRAALMTLKIAVLAPIPSARVRIATKVNPGVRRRPRMA